MWSFLRLIAVLAMLALLSGCGTNPFKKPQIRSLPTQSMVECPLPPKLELRSDYLPDVVREMIISHTDVMAAFAECSKRQRHLSEWIEEGQQ
jgi:hypothetical protein